MGGSPKIIRLNTSLSFLILWVFYLELCALVLLDKHHSMNSTKLHKNHLLVHVLPVNHMLHENEFEQVYEQCNSNPNTRDSNHSSLCNNLHLWKFFHWSLRINMLYRNNHNSMWINPNNSRRYFLNNEECDISTECDNEFSSYLSMVQRQQ